MTDVEMERLSAICAVANVNDIEDLSDGFHTFNDLYEQRMYLFAALVNAYKDKAWKSLKHEDGEPCFGGDWFVVGIDTPEGSYTYHYSIKYWDVFDCEVLPKAKHWDGHTDKDVTRLMSLQPEQQWIPCSERLPSDEDYDETFTVTIQCEHYDGWDDYVTGYADWTPHGWDIQSYYLGQIKVVAWMPLPKPWGGENDG